MANAQGWVTFLGVWIIDAARPTEFGFRENPARPKRATQKRATSEANRRAFSYPSNEYTATCVPLSVRWHTHLGKPSMERVHGLSASRKYRPRLAGCRSPGRPRYDGGCLGG